MKNPVKPMIQITETIIIDEDELTFTASRSAGPGGQNVNKVNTRITLWFNVMACPGLSPEQKERVLARLPTRVSKDGILRVVSQGSRSQLANREAAIERFISLLQDVLTDLPPRKKTKASRQAKARRMDEKKQQGIKKKQRGRVILPDEE
ncbi:MAG: alternative ribosome rescue aminoacyl-tRNA hydrolase ArfB [Desulfosalsimonadaceae bacterium]|nr:alternative ribosome rescue aminoacyl-tRNA hydrolase ArfB [Desulfosalsimonadaceae bacterium]